MSRSPFCTRKEAGIRHTELRAMLLLSLPAAELEGFMTSAKPPSLHDLIAYAQQRVARFRCPHCDAELQDPQP
jgi:hypothetical protein